MNTENVDYVLKTAEALRDYDEAEAAYRKALGKAEAMSGTDTFFLALDTAKQAFRTASEDYRITMDLLHGQRKGI